MIPKGTPVVVCDPDIRDAYNAILAEDWNEQGIKVPLVSIQTIIRYPIQTAVVYKDYANENPPLKSGQLCRLHFRAIRSTTDTFEDYERSFKRALMLAIKQAEQAGRDDCLAILRRHEEGKFGRKRSVCTN